MTADEKHHILPLPLGPLDNFNKLRRIEAAACRIEKDLARGAVPREQIKPPRNNLAHLAVGVTRAPFQKLRSDGVRVGIPGLADVINEDLHVSVLCHRSTIHWKRTRLGKINSFSLLDSLGKSMIHSSLT